MSNGQPLCPIHGKPLRQGKRPGNWYCATFVGPGMPGVNDKGYCSHQFEGVASQPAQPSFVAPAPSQAPQASSMELVAAIHELAQAIKYHAEIMAQVKAGPF